MSSSRSLISPKKEFHHDGLLPRNLLVGSGGLGRNHQSLQIEIFEMKKSCFLTSHRSGDLMFPSMSISCAQKKSDSLAGCQGMLAEEYRHSSSYIGSDPRSWNLHTHIYIYVYICLCSCENTPMYEYAFHKADDTQA